MCVAAALLTFSAVAGDLRESCIHYPDTKITRLNAISRIIPTLFNLSNATQQSVWFHDDESYYIGYSTTFYAVLQLNSKLSLRVNSALHIRM